MSGTAAKQVGRHVPGQGLDVGLLCQGWAPERGGVERHTADLARGLAQLGHRVHVLCLDDDPELEPYSLSDSEHDGVAVRRMAYRYQDHRRLTDLALNERADLIVIGWLADTPCDVIHVHHLTGFGLGALRAISEMGRPLAFTLHDYWTLCPRGQLLPHDGDECARPEPERCGTCLAATWPHLGVSAADAGERTRTALELLALPGRLVFPSAASRDTFARSGVSVARSTIIEHGVDVDGIAAAVERARASRDADGRTHVGLVGRVQPGKGVLELIEALAEVDDERLVLDVHGDLSPTHGDETYLERVRTAAARDARVRLHGPFEPERLPEVLAGLDAVAAPAVWEEVFGLSVREARAAGLPVLVSDRGGLSAAVDGPDEGHRLPAGDREAWARALAEWADLPERCPPRPGRPRDLAAMATDHASLYAELIEEAEAGASAAAALASGADGPRRGWWRRLFGG